MTIHRSAYVSDALAAEEDTKIWRRAWIAVAHQCELPDDGSFVRVRLAAHDVLVTRSGDGVHALRNVCRHRGAQLCDKAAGKATRFVCPYHAWSWSNDGALAGVPRRETFPADALEDLTLATLPAVIRHGLVWISLGPTPVDFDTFIAPLAPWLDAVNVAEWRATDVTRIAVDANWKAAFDVHNEALHLPNVHPQITQVADIAKYTFLPQGAHGVIQLPLATPDAHLHPGEDLTDGLRWLLDFHGIDANSIADRTAAHDAIYRAVAARANAIGVDVDQLGTDRIGDILQLNFFPNAMLLVQLGLRSASWYRFMPSGPGAAGTTIEVTSFSLDGTGDGPVRRRDVGPEDIDQAGEETAQDIAALQRLTDGLRTPGLENVILSDLEQGIAHLHAVWAKWMNEESCAST